MKYQNEPRDSDGYIAPFRNGMLVCVLSTNQIVTVDHQKLIYYDNNETSWGDVEIIYDDGTKKIVDSCAVVKIFDFSPRALTVDY